MCWLGVAVEIALLTMPTSLAAANSASAEHSGLLHEIQTDKYTYELTEIVTIDYVVTNVSGEPLQLAISYCSCELWVSVLDPDSTLVWHDPFGCFAETCLDTLEPGEFYLKHSEWDMLSYLTWDYIETPGLYTVRGELEAYHPPDAYFWIDLPIEIVEPTTAIPTELATTWAFVKALYR